MYHSGQQFDLLSEIVNKTHFEEHVIHDFFTIIVFTLHFLTIKRIDLGELVKYRVVNTFNNI